ncbi:MAG: sugar transferase [Cellvibrionaceae bacterium]
MPHALFRALDFTLALTGILLTLPLMLVITLVGLLDTGSPLFIQRRVGRHQTPFILIKFRTMCRTTQSVGTHLVDTKSITKLGAFLRKTKLDELPQLFNVLLGQMSLVGPRPCLPNQEALITERKSRGVFEARPGITGLAQIHQVDMSTPRKLARYDQLLAQRLSLNLYFQILIATLVGRGNGDRVKTNEQATPK